MPALRILIVDDHPSVRRGVRMLLESHPGWSVCAEASNGREGVEKAERFAPDVVLIDLTMPEVDGLQATRQIMKRDPAAQVLILTIHESETLAEHAAMAGAKGVLSKSEDPQSLIAAIESLARNVIHLAGSRVGRKRHIAALFHSPAERYRALAPFVAEGLSRGEKTIHIVGPPTREEHVRRMLEQGIELERAEREGTARLISFDEVYRRDHPFEQESMLAVIPRLLRETSAEGFPQTRLVAHMGWALSGVASVNDLIEYESRLNDGWSSSTDVLICAYDLPMFSASVIVDVIRCHPAVLMDSALHENPFYTPPETLLPELSKRSRQSSYNA